MVLPGMCYRNEQITARSEIQFHQIEGLAVGRNITFADLKGTLIEFARRYFGADRQTRFQSQLLPVHRAERRDGHLLHPLLGGRLPSLQEDRLAGDPGLRHGPSRWCCASEATTPKNGAALPSAPGPERIGMLRYGMKDIRYFWGNDLRFPGAVLSSGLGVVATTPAQNITPPMAPIGAGL